MTHGCLHISGQDDEVMLHTEHTAMKIPEVIGGAFDVIGAHYKFLLKLKDYATKEKVFELIELNAITDRMQFPHSAASLIIAAKPCFLEFVTSKSKEGLDDAPYWNEPYRLLIDNDSWLVLDSEGSVIATYDLRKELCKRLYLARKLP
jgi:hypothetical protein